MTYRLREDLEKPVVRRSQIVHAITTPVFFDETQPGVHISTGILLNSALQNGGAICGLARRCWVAGHLASRLDIGYLGVLGMRRLVITR